MITLNVTKMSERVVNTEGKGQISHNKQFLAPLAEGQEAIVMVLCPSCVRTCVHASVNSSFKKLLLRNY